MIDIDQVKRAATQLLEDQGDDLARFLVQAAILFIKDRKHAIAVIKRAHAEYDQRFAEIEERMKSKPTEGQG